MCWELKRPKKEGKTEGNPVEKKKFGALRVEYAKPAENKQKRITRGGGKIMGGGENCAKRNENQHGQKKKKSKE